jgi:hypothetical protein
MSGGLQEQFDIPKMTAEEKRFSLAQSINFLFVSIRFFFSKLHSIILFIYLYCSFVVINLNDKIKN